MKTIRQNDERASRKRRRATATVEFAICAPIVLMIVFASIEAASMIFLKQALQTTAYEATRSAVRPHSTDAEVYSWGNQMLQLHGVRAGNISIQPSGLSNRPGGTPITVTVSAQIAPNRILPGWFFNNSQMSASCRMLRE